jgi:hypothetical protein
MGIDEQFPLHLHPDVAPHCNAMVAGARWSPVPPKGGKDYALLAVCYHLGSWPHVEFSESRILIPEEKYALGYAMLYRNLHYAGLTPERINSFLGELDPRVGGSMSKHPLVDRGIFKSIINERLGAYPREFDEAFRGGAESIARLGANVMARLTGLPAPYGGSKLQESRPSAFRTSIDCSVLAHWLVTETIAQTEFLRALAGSVPEVFETSK